jgi:hypothetical protein
MVNLHGAMVSLHDAMVSLHGSQGEPPGCHGEPTWAMVSFYGVLASLHGDLVNLQGTTVSLCCAMVILVFYLQRALRWNNQTCTGTDSTVQNSYSSSSADTEAVIVLTAPLVAG